MYGQFVRQTEEILGNESWLWLIKERKCKKGDRESYYGSTRTGVCNESDES